VAALVPLAGFLKVILQPRYVPVAVVNNGGEPALRRARCSVGPIARAEIISPRTNVFDASDVRLWKVTFSPPVPWTEVGPAQTPTGATTVIPWQPPADDHLLVFQATLENGAVVYESFRPSELRLGRAVYDSKIVDESAIPALGSCK
jgi:hypothetical protein